MMRSIIYPCPGWDRGDESLTWEEGENEYRNKKDLLQYLFQKLRN